jgi:membrane protease subunit (stomatin/prohibitin family)
LRSTVIGRMTEIFANSEISFLDMAASQGALGDKLIQQMQPAFSALGLQLDQFVVENISLPEELQKALDQRIGMNMVGDLGRYTQYAAAQSMPIAAANSGGSAGMGMGIGVGAAVGQAMMSSVHAATSGAAASPVPQARFCTQCGKPIPADAHFCPECGKQQ